MSLSSTIDADANRPTCARRHLSPITDRPQHGRTLRHPARRRLARALAADDAQPECVFRTPSTLTVAAGVKIWRPRQLYVGAGKRDYVPVEKREDKNPDDPKAHPSTVGHATSVRAMAASYKNKVERQSRL